MKKTKIFGIALGVLALVAMAQPAQAACGAPFGVSSLDPAAGYYTYIINPSVTDDGYMGTSVTDQFSGFFWGLGVGDPALGVGADNGAFGALSWLYVYAGYPVSILTTWAASADIDGCIDVQGPLGDRCQVTYMQDVDTAGQGGLFALVSTGDTTGGDYILAQPTGDITLAPQMGMPILGSARQGETGVDLTVGGPTAESVLAGSYLSDDPACQGGGAGGTDPLNGLVTGFMVVQQVLPRGSQPPADFNIDQWTDSGAGENPLGSPVNVSVGCTGDSDVYLSYSLCFDSGFCSSLVSATTTRAECGPNVAEPQRIRVKPTNRTNQRQRTAR